jgi:hypothetical protein
MIGDKMSVNKNTDNVTGFPSVKPLFRSKFSPKFPTDEISTTSPVHNYTCIGENCEKNEGNICNVMVKRKRKCICEYEAFINDNDEKNSTIPLKNDQKHNASCSHEYLTREFLDEARTPKCFCYLLIFEHGRLGVEGIKLLL